MKHVQVLTQQDRIIFGLQPRGADAHVSQIQRINQPPVVILLRTLTWKRRHGQAQLFSWFLVFQERSFTCDHADERGQRRSCSDEAFVLC